MKKYKLFISLILIISLILTSLSITFASSPVQLDYINGKLMFFTVSKLATSGARYRTIGFTTSFKGYKGNTYITKIKMEQTGEKDNGDGTVTTYFSIPFVGTGNTILQRFMDTYGQKSEIIDFFSHDNTLQLDSIMTVIENGTPKGSISNDGTLSGEAYTDYSGIAGARAWSSQAKDDLLQYFGLSQYFPAQEVNVVPEPEPTPMPTPTPSQEEETKLVFGAKIGQFIQGTYTTKILTNIDGNIPQAYEENIKSYPQIIPDYNESIKHFWDEYSMFYNKAGIASIFTITNGLNTKYNFYPINNFRGNYKFECNAKLEEDGSYTIDVSNSYVVITKEIEELIKSKIDSSDFTIKDSKCYIPTDYSRFNAPDISKKVTPYESPIGILWILETYDKNFNSMNYILKSTTPGLGISSTFTKFNFKAYENLRLTVMFLVNGYDGQVYYDYRIFPLDPYK